MALPIKNNVLDFAPSLRQTTNVRGYQAGAQNNNVSSLEEFDIKLPVVSNTPSYGTKIVSQSLEEIDQNKFRKSQIFEQQDGRRFSKLEEISFSQNSIRKTIIQQNPSGSISQYEEVLDRKVDGSFRRTQRFQDGTGDTSTQITPTYTSQDPFILSNGKSGYDSPSSALFPLRGTQLDLNA